MAIKTTRIKSTQAPRVETLDLSNQLNGSRQTFSLPRDIHRYDRHYLVWNSTVYRNDANHRFYSISGDGKTLTTYFDEAPKGGPGYTLQLAVDMSGDGDDETVSQADLEEAVDKINANILAEGTARADQDAVLQEHIDAEATARAEADTAINDQISALKAASDVSDVVDTYADLEAYDKSTLTENDIVKVLNDSTHDGKQSYYRLVNNEWQWVASVSSQDERLTDQGARRANAMTNYYLSNWEGFKNDGFGRLQIGFDKRLLDQDMTTPEWMSIPLATTSVSGAMSAADKTKLDRIPQTIVSAAGIRQTSDDGKTSILVKYKNTATGEAYDDIVEIPTVSSQYNGLISIADKSKLDGLADIKSIGTGLALSADGELSSTNSGGLTDVPIATDTVVGGIKSSSASKGIRVDGGGYSWGPYVYSIGFNQYSTGAYPGELCLIFNRANSTVGSIEKVTTVPTATAGSNGAMSKEDKTKLDGMANIKTIGAGLSLSNTGELSSAASGWEEQETSETGWTKYVSNGSVMYKHVSQSGAEPANNLMAKTAGTISDGSVGVFLPAELVSSNGYPLEGCEITGAHYIFTKDNNGKYVTAATTIGWDVKPSTDGAHDYTVTPKMYYSETVALNQQVHVATTVVIRKL